MKKILALVIGLVALVAIGAGATYALTGDDERTERGTCEAASYELSADSDEGVLEVSFELLSFTPGETWDVVVEQGDEVLLDEERLTDDEAELDVDVVAGQDGADGFTVTATPETGQPCTVTVARP